MSVEMTILEFIMFWIPGLAAITYAMFEKSIRFILMSFGFVGISLGLITCFVFLGGAQ